MNRYPVPSKIKNIRQEAGLTQKKAAELLYVTTRSWQLWEHGKRKMHPAFFELFLSKIRKRS